MLRAGYNVQAGIAPGSLALEAQIDFRKAAKRSPFYLRYARKICAENVSVHEEVSQRISMLVLSRKRNEQIVIGDQVVITVVDIRGDKVRLGIEAPEAVPVHRLEVFESLRREADMAASRSRESVDTK